MLLNAADERGLDAAVHLLTSTTVKRSIVRFAFTAVEQVVRILDSGAARVLVDAQSPAARAILDAIPSDRLVWSNSGDAVDRESYKHVDAEQWVPELAKSARGDAARIIFEAGSVPLDHLAGLDAVSADVLVPAASLSVENVADAFWACAKTDRTDALFTTVVVDEQGVALGLVYSSKESLREAFAKERGVYYSRSRSSLWYKGDTSDARQSLIYADLDCDRDCIRFVVRQHGTGFCHLAPRNCFSTDDGIGHLMRTLEARKSSAPVGSYTKRLFDDSDLLASKIKEEAQELCDASEPNDIAWETADLIYFALVKCAAAGVSLADVEEHFTRRSRKVTRRPGNAKPAAGAPAPAAAAPQVATPVTPAQKPAIRMQVFDAAAIDGKQRRALLQRPVAKSDDILSRIRPIRDDVVARGDQALIDFTAMFDRVVLTNPVIDLKAPGREPAKLDPGAVLFFKMFFSNALHSCQGGA